MQSKCSGINASFIQCMQIAYISALHMTKKTGFRMASSLSSSTWWLFTLFSCVQLSLFIFLLLHIFFRWIFIFLLWFYYTSFYFSVLPWNGRVLHLFHDFWKKKNCLAFNFTAPTKNIANLFNLDYFYGCFSFFSFYRFHFLYSEFNGFQLCRWFFSSFLYGFHAIL